jgi:hypothetical protein
MLRALSPNIFTRPDGGSARSARPRLMEVIMVDRTTGAAAAGGSKSIDPAELHRVFPPAANTAERREPALEEQIKSLRQVSELLHDVRATGIMYETQSLAVRALRELLDNPDRDNWDELLAANRALIKAIAVAAEIATLRQKLAAAEACIQEMGDKDNAFKPFASWKSRTPTFDDLRERMAALISNLPKDS